MKEVTISTVDLIIILAYLVGILLIGILSVRKRKMSSSSFFLAGRSLNWGMIGAALFAANISTIHLVGLAANGFKDGLVWGNFEWMAGFLLIILGLFFAPFYFSLSNSLNSFLKLNSSFNCIVLSRIDYISRRFLDSCSYLLFLGDYRFVKSKLISDINYYS